MTTSSLKVFIALVAATILMVAATYLVYSDKTITTPNKPASSNTYSQPNDIPDSPINNSLNVVTKVVNKSVINRSNVVKETEVKSTDLSANADEQYTYDHEHALATVLSKLASDESSNPISPEDIAILESINTQDIDYEYIKTHIDDSLF